MKTITVFADIIIPKDDKSGSAIDAGVPAFIEFIVKDMPHYQTPLRGGIKWLDIQCMRRFNATSHRAPLSSKLKSLMRLLSRKAKPEMQQGVSFFNTMRDLTACGFFTSKIGIDDLGYAGNKPTNGMAFPRMFWLSTG